MRQERGYNLRTSDRPARSSTTTADVVSDAMQYFTNLFSSSGKSENPPSSNSTPSTQSSNSGTPVDTMLYRHINTNNGSSSNGPAIGGFGSGSGSVTAPVPPLPINLRQDHHAASVTRECELNNEKQRKGKDGVKDPCVSWAMLSYKSMGMDYRDWLLGPQGKEEPTGRLTSVDPRFPTICDKDQEMYSYSNDLDTTVSRFPADREVAYSMMIDEQVELNKMVQEPPKVRGVMVDGEYLYDGDDYLDHHLSYCLKRSTRKHDVLRKRPGVYQIDGREVCLEWRQRIPREASVLVICDGPMKQQCQDYLDGVDETAEYEENTMFDTDKRISNLRDEDRLSFGDSKYQSYTRLEAMRVAKEQAKLRESAAEKYMKTGLNTYRSKEEHMDKYRAWHKAQLQLEPPCYQWSDAPEKSTSPPPWANPPREIPAPAQEQGDNNLFRDPTLAPSSVPLMPQPNLPIPQLQIPGLYM